MRDLLQPWLDPWQVRKVLVELADNKRKDIMRKQYQKESLDDVMRFFVSNYTPKDGKVSHSEWYLDTEKKTVVFELFLEDKE